MIKILLLSLMALFIFSGCSDKEVEFKVVPTSCPKLQTFKQPDGSINSVRLDIEEVNSTVLSIEAVRHGEYSDMWLVGKKQVKVLLLHVLDVKDRLFNSLYLNDLYRLQIEEYNKNNSKSGNVWQSKKE